MTSAERILYIPDMPTVAETLPGYEVTMWYGLLFPTETPKGVREKVQSAAVSAIGMVEIRKRLEELGYLTIEDTPEGLVGCLHGVIEKMTRLKLRSPCVIAPP
jgi:tripartite-type tricarboxylate transporter receptor subunit TctC